MRPYMNAVGLDVHVNLVNSLLDDNKHKDKIKYKKGRVCIYNKKHSALFILQQFAKPIAL